jgi:hypothetical protein
MYIERFEYFCPLCKTKGIVTDVLLNPELMIIRGRCGSCGANSSYKAVDISALSTEYDVECQEEVGAKENFKIVRFPFDFKPRD